jgi:hypothetical protein
LVLDKAKASSAVAANEPARTFMVVLQHLG